VKCIFIGYGIGVKGYKPWGPVAGNFLYRRNVIFREFKPSPIMVQLEEDEKNSVIYLRPRPRKKNQKMNKKFKMELMRRKKLHLKL
jgi:hypothetical protein